MAKVSLNDITVEILDKVSFMRNELEKQNNEILELRAENESLKTNNMQLRAEITDIHTEAKEK